jgi:putative ABC transport system permease protein
MSLRSVLSLYRARLEARAVLIQEGFAVLGIAVGVALLFASQVASTSLTHSVQQLTRQVVGNTQLQLQARGPEGFDQSLLGNVRRLPGVQEALPVLEQQADVIGPSGGRRSVDLIGADPRFAQFVGPLLRRFSAAQLAAQHAIALPTPVANEIGARALEPIRIQIGASVLTTLLGTTLGESDIGGLAHSPIAVAPIAYAQALAAMPGRITRIFVRAAPGQIAQVHSELARVAAAQNLNLEPADFDATLFAVAATAENQGETLFSAISALVGFMFALCAMLVTVPTRRKLVEDLRPAGASRAMTIEVLLFDAAVLGVLACILGLALGELLSIAAFRATPGYLSSAFPVGNDRIVAWQTVALAVAAGLAAATVGVLWPLRDVIARPLEFSEQPRRDSDRLVRARLAGGLTGLAATTAILIAAPRAAFVGVLTLVIALVCLLPVLFDGLVAAFDRLQERLLDGAATVLAVTELQTPLTRVRSLAIALTAAVAVFGTVAVEGARVNLQHGLDETARQSDASAAIWVTPRGESSVLATAPFVDVDSATLRRVAGVRSVGLYRGSFLNWGDRRLWVRALPVSAEEPIPSSQLISGDLRTAVGEIRAGGWAVLSQALANEHGLRVGQSFMLPSPRPLRLRVAALSTNLGWPPGAIIMNSNDYARAWASGDPSAYEIQTQPGASPTAVRRLVQHALGPNTGLVAETMAERQRRHYVLAAQGLSRLTQIRLLVLLAGALAVAGALAAMIWQRRELIAFVKCVGYERAVLWRWLVCESAVLLVAGCSIGALFGVYGQLVISHALASVTGFPISLGVEGVVALSSVALVSATAVAIVALPGYLVVRVSASTISPAY